MAGLETAISLVEALPDIVKAGRKIYDLCQSAFIAPAQREELMSKLNPFLYCLQTLSEAVRYGLVSLRKDEQELLAPLMLSLDILFERIGNQLDRLGRTTGGKLDKVFVDLEWAFAGKRGLEAVIQQVQSYNNQLMAVIFAMNLRQTLVKKDERPVFKLLFKAAGNVFEQADLMRDALSERSDPPLPSDLSQFEKVDEFMGFAVLKGNDRYILLDPPNINSISIEVAQGPNYLDHAAVLARADPISMHILRCVGMVKGPNRPQLVYGIPYPPVLDQKWSLKNALEATLKESGPKIPLQARFRYATEICEAVMHMHAVGLVHKSICPENVVLLPAEKDSKVLFAFLVGFGRARLRNAKSDAKAELYGDIQVYHHPERLVDKKNTGKVVRFGIRHDMYSLGVMMLELGKGKPLRKFAYNAADLSEAAEALSYNKELLAKAAELAEDTGPEYADIVRYCLSVGDKVQFEDEKWSEAFNAAEENDRRRFYNQVLLKLKEIHV